MKLNRLYVGNIPNRLSKKALFELFSVYGTVKDVYIPFNKNIKRHPSRLPINMGYAFVEMTTDDEALNAISQLHNKVWRDNKIISVRISDLR